MAQAVSPILHAWDRQDRLSVFAALLDRSRSGRKSLHSLHLSLLDHNVKRRGWRGIGLRMSSGSALRFISLGRPRRDVHREASGNLSTACSGFSAPPRRGDGYANCANYPPALKATGLYFNQAIIWDKQHPALTRKDTMGSRVERVGFAWQRGKVFASAS